MYLGDDDDNKGYVVYIVQADDDNEENNEYVPWSGWLGWPGKWTGPKHKRQQFWKITWIICSHVVDTINKLGAIEM